MPRQGAIADRFRLLLASAQAALSEKRFADAERLFEEAVGKDATSKLALRGFAQVASDSGQWPAALDRWSRFVETWPTDPHRYTRLLVASIRLADFSSLTRAIEATSDYAHGNRDFWFAAIMPALFRLGRFHEARQASERFPKAQFTIANWAAYTTILHQTSQHDAIAKDYRDYMPSLNEDRTYTHYVLVALHKAGTPGEFDGALQRLSQAPAEHRLASLSRMLPSMLDEQTRRDLTRTAIDTGWLFKEGRNFVAFIDKVPEAMFPELQAAIDSLPNAAFKIVASHAFLRSLQLHRLAEAAIGNTSWASLVKESAGIHDRVRQMAAAADDEFLSIAPAVEDKARRAGLATAIDTVDLMAATDLALWIRHRIESRTPTSVIRFGDGEGNFLPYPPALKSFEAEDPYSTQQYWWGVDEDIPKGALAEEMVQAFRQAVDNADAIGIPSVTARRAFFGFSRRRQPRDPRLHRRRALFLRCATAAGALRAAVFLECPRRPDELGPLRVNARTRRGGEFRILLRPRALPA